MLRILIAFALVFVTAPAWAGFGGVVSVIDGDTLDVGGKRVRLFGIDAVESDQTCENAQGVEWACGAAVSREVRGRYQGQKAICEAVTIDAYGRIVARCQVKGRDIGRQLVIDGLALAYRKYSREYVGDELRAARARRGLHAGRMMRPAQFRLERIGGRVPEDRQCRIKGNISSRGARIYHLPGQRHYKKTGIRLERGERWFCTEREARAAGWRKSRS
jgi:endonuclease YncB( thermonuclease family)